MPTAKLVGSHNMHPGEILVAKITTPAWTPLFALAAGVVTDVGGPLSKPARAPWYGRLCRPRELEDANRRHPAVRGIDRQVDVDRTVDSPPNDLRPHSRFAGERVRAGVLKPVGQQLVGRETTRWHRAPLCTDILTLTPRSPADASRGPNAQRGDAGLASRHWRAANCSASRLTRSTTLWQPTRAR
jgi:hypothetical protein